MKVGKQTPGAFYIHKTLILRLSKEDRKLVKKAREWSGARDYTLIKIKNDKSAVSFLYYKDFDKSGHPELVSSVCVNFKKGTVGYTSYNHKNPPILHRKDSMVCVSYPGYKRFQELTRQEEQAGLLNSNKIGHKKQWESLLKSKGFNVVGHQLVLDK